MTTLDEAIKILLDAGYKPIGTTKKETFKIMTVDTYPSPWSGVLVTMGGRLRFEKPPYRATVGKRTVCLYEMVDGQPTNFRNIKTKDFNKKEIEK